MTGRVRITPCTLAVVAGAGLFTVAPAVGQSPQQDAGFVAGFLQDTLSGAGREVRIIGFEGALSARATMQELTIADDDGIWLVLRGAVLDWNRAALLRRQVEINELAADEIIILRAPRGDPDTISPEAEEFSLPELPVSVRIGRVQAARVEIGESLFGAEAVVSLDGRAVLAGGAGDTDLSITRIDGAEGALRLSGSFDNATRFLDLDLSLQEGADGIAANLIDLPDRPALSLDIAGSGLLSDFAAEIGLATDGITRLVGQVDLVSTADPDQPINRFRAALGGDLAALFAPEFQPFFGPGIALTAEGQRYPDGRLEVEFFDLRAERVALNGVVRLARDRLPEFIRIDGQIAAPDGTPVLLPISGERTFVDNAVLAVDFDAAESDDWRALIEIEGLMRQDFAADALGLEGTGQIRRDETAGIDARLRFAADGLRPADPALAEALGNVLTGFVNLGWRSGEPLALPSFGLSGTDFGLNGAGQVAGERLSGRVEARLERLSRFSALAGRPIQGGLNGVVEGEVRVLSGIFDLTARLTGRDLQIDQAEVDRLLAGVSQINASVRRDTTGTFLRSVTAEARTLSATLRGALRTGASDIEAQLEFADLSVLGGPYGGALAAVAHLTEGADGQTLRATATGTDLAAGMAELDNLLRGRSEVRIDATRLDEAITLNEFSIEAATLRVAADGLLREGAARLRTTLDFADLSVLGPQYAGQLTAEGSLREADGSRIVALDADARGLSVAQREADILLRGNTAMTLRASETDGRIRVDRFALENPHVSATASGVFDDTVRRVLVSARLANLALLAPGFSGPVTLDGTLEEVATGYLVDLTGRGPGGIDARATGTIAPNLARVDMTLGGSAELALINQALDPISVQGTGRFDLRVAGPPNLQSVSGRVSTTDARIVSPRQALTLSDVTVAAVLSGGRAQVDGSALLDGGTITLSGGVGLALPFNADLRAILAGIRLTDRRIFETRVSGDLAIRGPLTTGGTVSGALRLADTEIRIPSTGLGAGGFIPPMRHFSEPAAVRATREHAGLTEGRGDGGPRVPWGLDLSISAPNRVFVRGRGLDSELGGTLFLRGTTADVIPSGEFSLIRGRLDLLGRRFTLSEGFARLQGRFVPFIQLVASTSANGLLARIILSGEADALDIAFESVPELPDEEVLARLLFGQELGRLSAFQAAQLASAVATLAGRGGDGIVGNLRRGFGLDDLDISSDTQGNAALRVGKYLTENVYTDITVDSTGRSEVSINLDLSPSVTVRGRTDSSGRSGVGVFFERDY